MKKINDILRSIKSGFENGLQMYRDPLVEQGCAVEVRVITTGCLVGERGRYSPVSVKPERLRSYPGDRLSNSKTERKHTGTLCLPAWRNSSTVEHESSLTVWCTTNGRRTFNDQLLPGHKLAETIRKE